MLSVIWVFSEIARYVSLFAHKVRNREIFLAVIPEILSFGDSAIHSLLEKGLDKWRIMGVSL